MQVNPEKPFLFPKYGIPRPCPRIKRTGPGNRINVIIGGKVSTGQDAVNTGQTIIDNIAVEYRLDKTASRYVNLFYDRNYESLLEGQVTKMGGGIVLRKKADKLRELFIFRKKQQLP